MFDGLLVRTTRAHNGHYLQADATQPGGFVSAVLAFHRARLRDLLDNAIRDACCTVMTTEAVMARADAIRWLRCTDDDNCERICRKLGLRRALVLAACGVQS